MKEMNKTIVSHVAIQLVYTVVLTFCMANGDTLAEFITALFVFFLALLAHLLVAIVLMIRLRHSEKPHLIKAHLLGVLFALLIGGSTCLIAPRLFN